MKTKVTVEKSTDGSYAAYMEDDMPDFGLAGYGETSKEAIEDFLVAVEETREYLYSQGKQMPDLEFEYSMN